MGYTNSSKTPLRRKLITEIIAALLLLFYVHTFISTYVNLQSLKNMLPFYTANNNTVAWIVVLIEIAIILLLFLPRTRLAGFIGVLITVLFAGYLVIRHPDNPHHFGGVLNRLSDTQHILLYGLLSLLAIIGLSLTLVPRKINKRPTSDPIVFT